jgi:MFS transporter, DHA1 family, multidrug resistance protein
MQKTLHPPHSIDHHHRWRMTLAIMFIAQFLSGVGFSFVLPFLPFYFRSLGVESQNEILIWNAWASLVFGITMTFFALFWGLLSDRYGRKIMVMRSMFAGSIVLGLMGFATSPWHLVALRFLQGATTGTVSASITLVSSITPSANLGISLGLMQTALLLGTSAGPYLGGMLAEQYGLRMSCILAFFILITGAILVLFGASERFVPPRNKKVEGLKTIKDIIGTEGFKLIMSIYFLIYVLSAMVIPILPLYIEELLGTSTGAKSLTGTFVGVTGLIAGISAVIYGKLGDRFGNTRILVFSLLGAGLITIPQSFAQSIHVLFIERCLYGLAIGGILPSINSLVTNIISREKLGSAYGITSSVTCFGLGMGPFIGAVIAARFGLRWPFAIMGVSALIVAVLVYRMVYNYNNVLSFSNKNTS